jgi:uncharacterized membrane protein YcaP (DUF421 family)
MDIVLRTAAVFAFLLVLTRVIGRRELGSLEPFDLILLIVLGDSVQQGVTQDDYSLTGAFLVVGTFAILQVFVSWVSYRFPRTRSVIDGEPIIIIDDGQLIESNLKRERLSRGEIAEEARNQQIAHISDVRWGVLETTGKISFIKKSS